MSSCKDYIILAMVWPYYMNNLIATTVYYVLYATLAVL